MKNVRTLTELRNNLKGRIYIYLGNTEICNKFLQNTENEGFRFGKIKPTDSGGSDIIALEKNKQLSYVGFVGHMAFQCNGGSDKGSGFHRIDYRKFSNGEKDYIYKRAPNIQMKEFHGKFYDTVTVVGENYTAASEYIKRNLKKCEDVEQEESLYTEASEKFNVIVIEE